jgi:Fic family protein
MFIHEQEGWPRFSWDQASLSDFLAAVRHRQGRLIGKMNGLGFRLSDEARLETLTQDVLKTSEIEGEILDRDQVRSSIARRLGLDIGALTPADRDVEGVVEMMLDATQHYDEPITEARLYGWHASLFPTGRSGMRQIAVAAWRDDRHGPMQVVSGPIGNEKVHFEAPGAARLGREVGMFLQWFNGPSEIDPVLKAALAHLWFVTVHPFDDGNGRIARAISDMALARAEQSTRRFYSMSAQIRLDRREYYSILEKTQKGGLDVTPWMEWFLGCLDRAVTGAQSILASVLKKAEFWEAHADESFNDRQRKVLNRLLDGFEGKLTSTKWARLAKCSQDTAGRDINDLVAREILKKNPGGGRSTSYSLVGSATDPQQ